MSLFDHTTRFLFEESNVRGEFTQLDHSLKEVLSKHNYPLAIKALLGEFMAAAAMLSDTIKFNGTLSLQVKGAGQVRTLMAECRNNSALRAIAQYNDDFTEDGPILGEGQMAITIEPEKGQRYQGIVRINDGDLTLANVLEDYFLQSEQIRTRIWLFSNEETAAGMLLQSMPKSASESSLDGSDEDDSWDRLTHLAGTLKSEEVASLDTQTILHRLFHEETVRVYPARDLKFECTCSDERSQNAITILGREEAMSLIAEVGHIDIDCQFCHSRYVYTAEQVEAMFKDSLN